MNWVKPNTITGSVAEGDKYFRRDEIESRIWDEILNHNHVLFLAPRRVGKSSIVKYMSDNPTGPWYCKYENIQSDRSVQDFYKRLCRMTNESVSIQGKLEKLVAIILKKYKIVSLGPDAIDLEHQEINYRDLFFEILKHLKKEKEKVVLFLDEFPDVIHNIYNDQGAIQAEQLLSDLRTFRQSTAFKDVFVMVHLGSVGLNHIVTKISGRTDKVNDLHKEYLSALSHEQALNFLEHLLNGASMKVDNETRNYLLNKIGHFIPYYIQLVIEDCDQELRSSKRQELNSADIDAIYKLLIAKNEHFVDWENRLSRYFPDKYEYLMAVLSTCAKQKQIELKELFNIAIGKNIKNDWKAFVDDVLVADGYLYEENGNYAFNSPLLRDWWKARFPLF